VKDVDPMDHEALKAYIAGILPEAVFTENKQYPEVLVPAEKLHEFCQSLRDHQELNFNYLISLTAVDWSDHFMMVYHLTSSGMEHTMVVKCRIDDRQDPSVKSVSDIWKTAEYHEREVFDLFGISFLNHPDLRRLFLEDDYGYPLRKDFTDETRMIIR
jgi:NADH:ubiquinone oxidoreductase subunit C